MATIFKLIIEDDEGKTTVYPLSNDEISIGRREGNTIRLMERNVSRRHARLVRGNGAVLIEDLDSYNGIRINGERIHGRYEIKEGDLVEIGDYHLALQEVEVAAEAANDQGTDAARPREGWPSLAGTVPDFRLASEAEAEPRRTPLRDTIIDTPRAQVPSAATLVRTVEAGSAGEAREDSSPTQAEPIVKPPPRGGSARRELPPFPGPGAGLSGTPAPLLSREDVHPSSDVPTERPPPAVDSGPGLPAIASVPRLICVSTEYAGREFPLTRPELIIGRVEDNDIVIEHRSVSRNHGKVVFDGRTHKIIDLQSANGILVNGEEYAMTDLRRGDLIELGHVRFRFIPSGETFVPTDEEVAAMKEVGVSVVAPANGESEVLPETRELKLPPLAQTDPSLVPPKSPGEVPADVDPSTAATVTDTPLSALSMGSNGVPRIDVSEAKPSEAEVSVKPYSSRESSPPSSSPQTPAVARERRAELPARSDADAASIATLDVRPSAAAERATEINRAHGVSDETTERQRAPTRVDPPSDLTDPVPGRPRMGLVLAGFVGAVLIIGLVAAIMLRGPAQTPDEALQELYQRQRYAEAVRFYKSASGTFKNPAVAQVVFENAQKKVLAQKSIELVNTPSSDDPDEPETAPESPLPEGDEPEAVDEPEGPDPEVPDELRTVPVRTAQTPKAITKAARPDPRPRRRPPRKRTPSSRQRAKQLGSEGKRLLFAGDLSKAERLLKQCLALAPVPECHRTLGVLYAQGDDTEKALYHYKRYLTLAPNAHDADVLRALIKGAENPR